MDPTDGISSAAARNVNEIARLEESDIQKLPLSERVSLAVTRRLGTFWTVLLHLAFLAGWTLLNVAGPESWRFDPYPFGLLTMLVSMEGVLVALLVLVTQNRMAAQSDQRDRLNLQVDMLAEQEMTMVLRILSRIGDKLGIEPEGPEQEHTEQLMKETNIYQLMEELRRKYH